MTGLTAFVKESNRIEGILREPTKAEIDAHKKLLRLSELDAKDIEDFVAVIAPGHQLRRHVGLDVRVGNHIAPPGGMNIVVKLDELLADLGRSDPYEIHQRYEHLHPFTDGNGRSGRAIWLWMFEQMGIADRVMKLGFLHSWYYASLSHHHTKA